MIDVGMASSFALKQQLKSKIVQKYMWNPSNYHWWWCSTGLNKSYRNIISKSNCHRYIIMIEHANKMQFIQFWLINIVFRCVIPFNSTNIWYSILMDTFLEHATLYEWKSADIKQSCVFKYWNKLSWVETFQRKEDRNEKNQLSVSVFMYICLVHFTLTLQSQIK